MMRLRWIFSPMLAMALVVTACSGDSLVPSREPSSDDPSVEDPSGPSDGSSGDSSGDSSGGSTGDSSGGSSGEDPSWPDEIPSQDWLSYIDDATYVSRLTIPGTHDAATSTCQVAAGKCQVLTIAEQLDAGVRAFDLRPSMDDNSTLGNIYHSILDTGVSMSGAMSVFDSFLAAHPGEFVIVLMRYESDRQIFSKIDESYYKAAMRAFLSSDPHYQARKAAFRKDLTVGEMRGKILIISRNDLSPDSSCETAFTGWNHGNTAGAYTTVSGTGGMARIFVQDMYSPAQNDDSSDEDFLAKKKELVCAMMDISASFRTLDVYANAWMINYCSAYVGSPLSSDAYARNAVSTNRAAYDHLTGDSNLTGFSGLIMMDYAATSVYSLSTSASVSVSSSGSVSGINYVSSSGTLSVSNLSVSSTSVSVSSSGTDSGSNLSFSSSGSASAFDFSISTSASVSGSSSDTDFSVSGDLLLRAIIDNNFLF